MGHSEMEKAFSEFASKLQEIEIEKLKKARFLHEHKFMREYEWVKHEAELIQEIRNEAQNVANGRTTPSEIKLYI